MYWLVEDQYNDDLYQLIEVCDPAGCTEEWLNSMSQCIREHEGWGVAIGHIDGGSIFVFADRLIIYLNGERDRRRFQYVDDDGNRVATVDMGPPMRWQDLQRSLD